MKYRLRNIAAVLSLLLCTATAAVWVRSMSRFDNVGCYWRRGNPRGMKQLYHLWAFTSQGGFILKYQCGDDLFDENPPSVYHSAGTHYISPSFVFGDVDPDWFRLKFVVHQFAGFGYLSIANYSWRTTGILVPLWAIVLVFSILPISSAFVSARRFRGHRRASRGKCRRCGYDLRGTPGRCPECGTIPPIVGRARELGRE